MTRLAALLLLLVAAPAHGQPYQRGAVVPRDLAQRVAQSARPRLTLEAPLPDAYDARQAIPGFPVLNQGDCGSCWCFSGTMGCTVALLKAGQLKAGEYLSQQYVIDECAGRNGGCGGDWYETVTTAAAKGGLPLASDYPSYNAREYSCRSKGGERLFRIKEAGYVGTSEGVPPTADIQAAIYRYGCVMVACAAGGGWDNWPAGTVYEGRGARGINHAVLLIGWGTDSRGIYWLLQNSWGTGWADKGVGKVRPGADMIGYGAMWAVAESVAPPTPVPSDRYTIAGTVQVVAAGKALTGPATAILRGKATAAGQGTYTLTEATVTPSPGVGTYTLAGVVTLRTGQVEGTVTLTPGGERSGAVVGTILLTPAPAARPAPTRPPPPAKPLPVGPATKGRVGPAYSTVVCAAGGDGAELRPVARVPPPKPRPACQCSGECCCSCNSGGVCTCRVIESQPATPFNIPPAVPSVAAAAPPVIFAPTVPPQQQIIPVISRGNC